MVRLKNSKLALSILPAMMFGMMTSNVQAASAAFNPATGIVDMPVVEVLNGASSTFFNVQLQIDGNALKLISANPIPATKGQER
ncbi:MAG: hypothetical protein KDF49_08430, partial [Nitrosomonas sp.]|nr:hypothetical protein [Nitrosomonas sp.]